MTKELNNQVNLYLANIGVSYIKLHNLHWNVTGKQFKSVHEYLETLYDAFADVLDEVAELLKIDGLLPPASMKEYLNLATITELESKDYTVEETLLILLADLETLKVEAEGLRDMAVLEDRFTLANSLEDQITDYAKNIWFIKSMLK